MYKDTYSVYTYTENLPEKVMVADKIGDIPVTFLDSKCFCKRAFSNNSMLEAINGIENVENIEEDPFSGTPFENKTV